MTQPHQITLKKVGALSWIILDAQESGNALTLRMVEQLDWALGEIEQDSECRLVCLTGSGDKFFCAGGSFRDWGMRSPASLGRRFIRATNRAFDRLQSLDPLIVCYINGAALGGGLELALAADLRVAHSRAQFSLPEVTIGVTPGMRSCVKLAEVIGAGRAREMALTGVKIDSATALDWGLIGKVSDQVVEVVEQQLCECGRRSKEAVASIKQLFRIAAGGPAALHAGHELAGSYSQTTGDAREGLQALLEKRTPRFGADTDRETEDGRSL